jgi:membrane protein DedA with SNARE-associated domain
MTTAQGKANGHSEHEPVDDAAHGREDGRGQDRGDDAGDAPAPTGRADLPWVGRPQRADLICWAGIALSGLYALALIPVRPLLIGDHPVLLELLTGSMTSIVTAGAFARVGEVPLALAVTAAIPGMIMFDPFFWWAGRRWGRAMLTIFAGRSRRGGRLVTRAETWGRRLGWLGVVLAYYLPIPAALVFVVAGWTGMRLVTFVLLDAAGALLWIVLLAGLGYYLGQDAVDVAKTISHYGLWISIGLVVAVLVSQRVKTLRAPSRP